MQNNINEDWFKWFYKSWEDYCPGDLIDNGLKPTQIAERFVNDNQEFLIEYSKKFDIQNYDAFIEYIKLSESELHVFIYFAKLIKLGKTK